jgi:hypothetical protein
MAIAGSHDGDVGHVLPGAHAQLAPGSGICEDDGPGGLRTGAAGGGDGDEAGAAPQAQRLHRADGQRIEVRPFEEHPDRFRGVDHRASSHGHDPVRVEGPDHIGSDADQVDGRVGLHHIEHVDLHPGPAQVLLDLPDQAQAPQLGVGDHEGPLPPQLLQIEEGVLTEDDLRGLEEPHRSSPHAPRMGKTL